MNSLEKLKTLLSNDELTVKVGGLTDETTFPVVTIESGESEETKHTIHDGTALYKPTYIVTVHSQNYSSGFDLLNSIIDDIKESTKQSMYLLHVKNFEPTYDETKNIYSFKSQFKEIKIG